MQPRGKDKTTRFIKVMTEFQSKPFQAICRNVINELGSERAAYTALGVSPTVFRRLMLDGFLTDKMARVILEKRKAMKKK